MLLYLSKVYGAGVYKPTIREIRIWFGVLNTLIFKNKIQKFRYITIHYRRQQVASCHGYYDTPRFCNLEINPRFRDFKTFLKVLIHEMVHSYQFINQEREMSHGRYFFNWKKRIEKHGLSLETKVYNRGGKLCGLD